ncbi:MAG: GDP-mannose 4,6-dehydratase [bacterium]
MDEQVHPNEDLPSYFNEGSCFIRGDVRDYDALRKAIENREIIFHEAGAVGVGQSQYEIKKYVDVNCGGTANLLDILVNTKNKVEKLIVAASMSSYGEGVYECGECGKVRPDLRTEEQMRSGAWEPSCPICGGQIKPIPTDETAKQNCNSIYAITKKVQEDMVLNIGKTYGIPSVALRYFNVYGPRQSLSNPYTGVAAIFMSRIKNDNQPVIYEDGLQTRDFISVHDIVQANMLALEKEEANYQVFNVGSGKPLTIKFIAEVLAKLYGKDINPCITNKFRKGDVRHCYADITKIRKSLGFTPKISFEEGMRELIEWARVAESEDRFEEASQILKMKGLV